jgi:hypothetical protein
MYGLLSSSTHLSSSVRNSARAVAGLAFYGFVPHQLLNGEHLPEVME